MIECYKEVRVKIIQYIETIDEEKYQKIQNNGTIYKIQDIIDEFEYSFILHKIFILDREIKMKYNFILIDIMPIYVRILYILRVINSWYYHLSMEMYFYYSNDMLLIEVLENNKNALDDDVLKQIMDVDRYLGLFIK